MFNLAKTTKNIIWLIVALASFCFVNSLTFSNELSPQGQVFIALTICMLIIWVTETVNPAVSAFIAIGLLSIYLPFTVGANGKALTSSQAFTFALSGYTSSAWLLVLCAFFMVAGIELTGLGKRIGLTILRIVGIKPKRIILGIIVASVILNFFIPGVMPVSALVTSIMVGIVAGYKLDMKSNIVKGFFVTVGVSSTLGNIFILTGGAPAIQLSKFIFDGFGYQIKYLEYMMYGLPLVICMATFIYFLVTKMFPAEYEELPGGESYIKETLAELGPMSTSEKKLMIIMLLTITMWATGGYLHKIDMSSVGVITVIAMLFPGMGMGTFNQFSEKVAWGTMIFFGAAISMGTGLLTTGAATYIAKNVLFATGVQNSSMLIIICFGLLFFALASLAFSARASAIAGMIPSVIAFSLLLQNNHDFNAWGFTLIMYYPILFSVILPVNSPSVLIPYGTGSFETQEFMKVSIPFVILTCATCAILYLTYWKWVGLV